MSKNYIRLVLFSRRTFLLNIQYTYSDQTSPEAKQKEAG